MSYPPEWPEPGKMHFRLVNDRLGTLDLDCDNGYVLTAYNLGFPDIREVKLNNSLDDGVFDVTRFFGGRAVSLDVTLKGHTGLTPASTYVASEAYLRDRLVGYLYPGIRSRLLFSEHGDTRVRQMMIRGTSASVAVNKKQYNHMNASWLAPRGTMYSYDERCYLYQFSELSGDFMDLVIVNEGTVPVDWRASISGYSVHPRFTLNGTEVLRLVYDAAPGDVVTLDSFSRTITINGRPASYAYIDDDAVWFKIPPGFNTLRVAHLSGLSGLGYPYARWQPPISAGVADDFERAGPGLGANWVNLADLPDNTVAVPLAIDAGEVTVTVADDGTGAHEWGFAQHTAALTGGGGTVAELDVTNLVQPSYLGPTARSKVELYTNRNAADAACQTLHVDLDYGLLADPVAPIVMQDPFETLGNWEIAGSDAALVPVGRTGSALRIGGTTTSASYNFPADPPTTIIVVGAGVLVYSNSTVIPGTRTLFELRGEAGAILHGKVQVDVTGAVSVTDAAGVAQAKTAAGVLLANTWAYVEVRVVLDDDIGECVVRVDGADVGTAFDIDTNGGGSGYDQIRLPSGTILYDDFYLATGADAEPVGPLSVANGSLAWSLHQYGPTGTPATPVASGSLPYNYDDTAVRLRLESGGDGEQRFLLNGRPIAAEVEAAPIVGDRVGFGASWETFDYSVLPAAFTDLFERATLGTDWTLPVARTTGATIVAPTISAGAAVTAMHSAVPPSQYGSSSSSGVSLAGGVALPMPSSLTASYLCIARVLQDNPRGVPLTASTGWTQLGTARQGTDPGNFLEAFDNLAAWLTTGTVALVAGRTGTGGARITGANTANHADYVLPTADATVIVGFAHQINSLAAAASEIVQFYGDANVTQHNRLTVATNGSLSFWRGATNLGTSAAGVIAINTWNYIEVRTVLSDTVGEVTVRVNGTAVLTLTAQDTKNAGTAIVYDTIRLTGPIASFFNTFDDLYVLTGSGAAFTGSQTIAASSGTEFIRASAYARVCDGTSNDLLTVTGAASPYVAEIETYWIGPAGFTSADLARIKFASAVGATGFADPPSIDLGATARDWRFLTVGALDTQGSASITASTGYSIIYGTNAAPGNVCAMRSAYKTASQGGAENPAAYTGSTTNRPWIAFTLAIPGGPLQWGAAEHPDDEFDAASTITVEAVVTTAATGGSPLVELYSHMVHGLPTCRVLQIDLTGRTWTVGHYDGTNLIVGASGVLPAGAFPVTLRLEGDPGGTSRFLFNGTLVQTVVDATAPTPTVPTRVGFGEFWSSGGTGQATPQIQSFTATGVVPPIGPPPDDPTSPRIERFAAWPLSGTDWAIPPGGAPNIQDAAPDRPRDGAPSVEEDEVPLTTPSGSPLDDFRGPLPGVAIYENGWAYDGYGWRNQWGQALTGAGVIIGTGGVRDYPNTGPRPDAPMVDEDEVPSRSPGGAAIDDFRGPAPGWCIYRDGWVYDGFGWRNPLGQAVAADGSRAPDPALPANNPPVGGKPPWAWTPPIDPLTGQPSILTVHFCFFDQWL